MGRGMRGEQRGWRGLVRVVSPVRARVCRSCARTCVCVMDALPRRAVHRALRLGADVAMAMSSLGEYWFLIGAIAMARQAPHHHLSPLPRPASSEPICCSLPRAGDHPSANARPWASPASGNPRLGRKAKGGQNLQLSVEGEDGSGRLQEANCGEVWEGCVCVGWGCRDFRARSSVRTNQSRLPRDRG